MSCGASQHRTHTPTNPCARRSMKPSRREDAGLATELTLGVLRWQRLLDFLIDRNLTKTTKTLDVEVRIALRLGIYQLWFLERVPAHAAVHESVELVKRARKRSAATLVNAVLRKAAKEAESNTRSHATQSTALLPKELPLAERLGILHSHPTWLVERWLRTFGEERTLRPSRVEQSRPGSVRVTCSIRSVARRRWPRSRKRDAWSSRACLLRDAWTLHGGNPAASEAVQRGWVAIQDEASQAVAHLVAVEPGNTVLDLCAAPGGKTLLLAQAAGPQGHVIAADLHEHRVRAMARAFRTRGHSKRRAVYARWHTTVAVRTPLRSHSGRCAVLRNGHARAAPGDSMAASRRRSHGFARAPGSLAAERPRASRARRTVGLFHVLARAGRKRTRRARSARWRCRTDSASSRREPRSSKSLREGIALESVICADGFFRTFPPEHGTDGFFAAVIEHNTEKH